jgi:hypothetical protein
LRSFIDRVVVEGTKGKIYYNLPVPPEWKEQDEFSVLPVGSPSGDGVTIGRTFELEFSLTL